MSKLAMLRLTLKQAESLNRCLIHALDYINDIDELAADLGDDVRRLDAIQKQLVIRIKQLKIEGSNG